MVLHLRAKPNARANALHVAADGSLTVRLAAPAQGGEANACLLALLATVFGLPKSAVELLSGHTAPFKKVRLHGLDEATGRAVLRKYRA